MSAYYPVTFSVGSAEEVGVTVSKAVGAMVGENLTVGVFVTVAVKVGEGVREGKSVSVKVGEGVMVSVDVGTDVGVKVGKGERTTAFRVSVGMVIRTAPSVGVGVLRRVRAIRTNPNPAQ